MPEAWSDATGKPVLCKSQDPIGTFSLSKDPKVDILPPLESGAARIKEEPSRMRAVLALEGACQVPDTILAKIYFHARRSNGQIAGTVWSSEEAGDRRREHLVHVRSHVRQAGRRGQGEVRAAVNIYGAV